MEDGHEWGQASLMVVSKNSCVCLLLVGGIKILGGVIGFPKFATTIVLQH
jgi:hypothetical protein